MTIGIDRGLFSRGITNARRINNIVLAGVFTLTVLFGALSPVLGRLIGSLGTADAFSGSGEGSYTSPYLIDTCEELQTIGSGEDTANKIYWLEDDIDCTATATWNAGAGFEPLPVFEGTFDGRGNTITGLTINRPTGDYVGLFRTISEGVVTSVTFDGDTNITGDQYVGVLAGSMDYSLIRDVHASGQVSSNNYAGGLVGSVEGWIDDAIIERSSFEGIVSADNWAGGLVGQARYGFSIIHSFTDIDIEADVAGGIVGHVQDSCGYRFINSVAVSGSINAVSYGGGIVGEFENIICAVNEINDSVSYATITGGAGKGGIAGQLVNSTVASSNVYFDATAAGTSDCAGMVDGGSVALSCSELGSNEPPSDPPFNDSDWDFENIWRYDVGLALRTPFSLLSVPGVVTSISSVEGENPTDVDVSWEAPDENGGLAIEGYRVEVKEAGEEWDNIVDDVFENESLTTSLNNLRLGNDYDIRIRAETLYGPGEWVEVVYSSPEPQIIEVDTCQELQDMPNEGSHLDTYILTNDIDCSGFEGFEPLSWVENDFQGHFDGQGNTISGLQIEQIDEGQIGLFRYTYNAVFENLTLADGSSVGLEDSYDCGALIGEADSTVISNVTVENYVVECMGTAGGVVGDFEHDDSGLLELERLTFSGTVTASSSNAGGLFGYVKPEVRSVVTLQQSYADATVSAEYKAGGLIGHADVENDDDDDDPAARLTLLDTYSKGEVLATESAGGLVGEVEVYNDGYDSWAEFEVESSYSESVVDSGVNAGGLVGYVDGLDEEYTQFSIRNSFAVGPVTADVNDYGLIGGDAWDEGDGVFESEGNYFDITATGQDTRSYNDGVDNGYGINLDGTQADYFIGNSANPPLNTWDFDTVWQVNDSYPTLRNIPVDSEDAGAQVIFPNGDESKAILIEQLEGTEICSRFEDDVFARTESQLDVRDAAYDYSSFLVGFTLSGCDLGGTTTMRLIFTGDFNTEDIVLRKYNAVSRSFATVQGAVVTKTTLNDLPAVDVRYQITDGGDLDQDGVVNGSIVDPVGLAVSVVGAPNTGIKLL